MVTSVVLLKKKVLSLRFNNHYKQNTMWKQSLEFSETNSFYSHFW